MTTFGEIMQRNEKPFLESNHDWFKQECGEVDMCRHSCGCCNGPVCRVCGYATCVHCNKGEPIPQCPEVQS